MIQTIRTSKFLRILKILMPSCQELGRDVMGCFIQEYHEQQHQQLEHSQVVIFVNKVFRLESFCLVSKHIATSNKRMK